MHRTVGGSLMVLTLAALAGGGVVTAAETMTPLERAASTPKGQLNSPYPDFASVRLPDRDCCVIGVLTVRSSHRGLPGRQPGCGSWRRAASPPARRATRRFFQTGSASWRSRTRTIPARPSSRFLALARSDAAKVAAEGRNTWEKGADHVHVWDCP